MKKIAKSISVLLATVFIFAGMSVSVSAAGETSLTITVYDDIAAVTSCSPSASGVIDIPSEKNGIPVVMIGGEAFKDCTRITQVNIPASVTRVGDNAFDTCLALEKVVFAGANCEIGDAAFKSCDKLTDVTLPSGLKAIPDEAFYDCASLVSLEIPGSTEVIGKEAFRICISLTQVNIPASVNVIKKNAFLGCKSVTEYNVAADNEVYSSVNGVLYGPYQSTFDDDYANPVTDKTLIQYPAGRNDKSYNVQAGTAIIGDYSFGGNKNISSVTIPDGVTMIDDYAFNESSLSQINIPSTVTKIGKQAFGKCVSLKNVTVPASVTNFDSAFYMAGIESVTIANGVSAISPKAFEGCSSLTQVSIPSSVKTIGMAAFYGCSSLGDVEIPASVTSIGGNAFTGCQNIRLIVEKNSAAHTYAVENEITYEIKKDGGNEPTTKPSEPATEPSEPTTKPSEPTTRPSESKKVVSISVDKLPDKTNYYYKDTINTDGMRVEVIYSDGSSEIITKGFAISPAVCTERGIQTVEVEYLGFTDEIQVNVSFAWWQWLIWILLLGFLWY